MPTPLEKIRALYPLLNSADRQKLKILVNAFQSGGKQRAVDPPDRAGDYDWLFQGILSELARRGLYYNAKRPADVKGVIDYVTSATLVRNRLRKYILEVEPHPKREVMNELGRVAARALADYIDGSPVPIGLKAMMTRVHYTFQAIELSFPGYLEYGMIHLLVKSLREKSVAR